MPTRQIRETIQAAVRQERRTGELANRLRGQLPDLQKKLVLPEEHQVVALIRFVTDYVESVPGCIKLVTAVSQRLEFYDYAAPFLHMAEDFFLQPPDEVPGTGGLEDLLDEAFLAHRLLEEVNDHHFRHLQRSLLPVDMTEANIIVHHLLGENLANRLEQLVHYAAQRLLTREHVWERVRSLPGAEISLSPEITSSSLASSPHRIKLRLAN